MSRDRLDKLLGMLGSDSEQERATAGRMIHHIAHLQQLTIVQLIEREFGGDRRKVAVRPVHKTARRDVSVSTEETERADGESRLLLDRLWELWDDDRIDERDARLVENVLCAYTTDADLPVHVSSRVRLIIRSCSA